MRCKYFILPLLLSICLPSKHSLGQQIVRDADGNTYNTVTIGKQVWLKENLRVTRYNDSTPIPMVSKGVDWYNLYTPAYCWYDNDSVKYAAVYGALYNWHAVNTGKLCPKGWHVPSDEEWNTLATALGGPGVAALKLKEAGGAHWLTQNKANNQSRFTALPGGFREWDPFGKFKALGRNGYWWTSTRNETSGVWYRYMIDQSPVLWREGNWYSLIMNYGFGFCVRCLKD